MASTEKRAGNRGKGRPKGSRNRRTTETLARAMEIAGGASPLDVLLRAMRHFVDCADRGTTDEAKGVALSQAAEMARHAAPYVHARLQAVEHTGPNGGPIQAETRQVWDWGDGRKVTF